MAKKAAELREERNGILTEMRDLAAKAESENRDFTDDERTLLAERMGKAKGIAEELQRSETNRVIKSEVEEFLNSSDAKALNEEALHGATTGDLRQMKSLGQHFLGSKEWKSLNIEDGRTVSSGRSIKSDPVRVPGGLKALIGTGDVGGSGAGNLWEPQRLGLIQQNWPRLTLRQVVTNGTTTSDAVEYAKVLRPGTGSPTVNNAAGVPEATSTAPIGTGTGQVTPIVGGLKPESALGFKKETAPVITVATWVPATKKALSDAGQLRTLIDNFLTQSLAAEVDRQLLSGDSGAGEEFDGLLNQDGLQAQAFDTNIAQTIRKAITKVSVYSRPNAVLVSPGTAERIDLLHDKQGRYLGNGPFGAANPSIWRTPLVEVAGLSDATVLVGDFTTAVIWDREDATITATDSHADFFVRNLVAILAEARAAFGVLDPALIAKATVTGTDVF